MKVYVPAPLLELFVNKLTTIVIDPEDADVSLLFIDDHFTAENEEYLRLKERPHIVVVTKSNLNRRHIPVGFVYDLYCNVRSKKKYAELIEHLNGDRWTFAPTKGVKKKAEKVNSIREASEQLKEERTRLEQDKRSQEERLRAERLRLEQERDTEEERLRFERTRLEKEKREEEEWLIAERLRLAQEAPVSDKNECKICMSSAISVILQPCAHACACHDCALQCDNCPICRRRIVKFEPIFIA